MIIKQQIRYSFWGLLFSLTTNAQNPALPFELKLDSLFKSHANQPGGFLAIVKDGKPVYEKTFGSADIKKSISIDKSTVFDLASLSKQFTAMCVYLLEEQGKISIEDPVVIHLPEYRNLDSAIRIKHLITHSSGIWDYISMLGMTLQLKEKSMFDEHVESLIQSANQNFEPGEAFLYSNSGYYLLGRLIERVSGMSLREYSQKNIFDPLGMSDTYFHDDKNEKNPSKAIGYKVTRSGKFKADHWNDDVTGDHNLYSSPEDMIKWMINFGDNKLGIDPPRLMMRYLRPIQLSNEDYTPYAGGLYKNTNNGLEIYGHGGRVNGFRSKMSQIPKRNIGIILMTNSTAAYPMGHFNVIMEWILKDLDQTSDFRDVRPGVYQDQYTGELLWLTSDKAGDLILNDRIRLKQEGMLITPGRQFIKSYHSLPGKRQGIDYGLTHFESHRYSSTGKDLNPSMDWVKNKHLGRFENKDLKIRVKIKRKGDQLKLSYIKVKNNLAIGTFGSLISFRLKSIYEDLLYLPMGNVSIEFSDQADEFYLSGQRFRNLNFRRVN